MDLSKILKVWRAADAPKGLSRNQDKLSSPQEKSYLEIIKNLEVNNVVPKAEQHCYDFRVLLFEPLRYRWLQIARRCLWVTIYDS